MARRSRYSPEVKERAVRMVLDQQHQHESQWAVISDDRLGRVEDWVHVGDAAQVGASSRT